MARTPLFSWRVLRLHLALVACVVAFGLLANWQFHRALAGNELSWAYAVEWPLFIVYAFVLWRRLVLDELGRGDRRSRGARWSPFGARHAQRLRERREQRGRVEDLERERYNAYLASIAADEGRDDRRDDRSQPGGS